MSADPFDLASDPHPDPFAEYEKQRVIYERELASWAKAREDALAAHAQALDAVRQRNNERMQAWEKQRDEIAEKQRRWHPSQGALPQLPPKPRLEPSPMRPHLPSKPLAPIRPRRAVGRPRLEPGARKVSIPLQLSSEVLDKVDAEAEALGIPRQRLVEQILVNRTRMVALPAELVAEIDAIREDLPRGEAVARIIREAMAILGARGGVAP